MGMGYAACHAWVITQEDLQKIVPEAAAKFFAVLEKLDWEFDQFCDEFQWDRDADEVDEEERPKKIVTAWKKLQDAFGEATKVDDSYVEGHYLSLEVSYQDEDAGSRYDEVGDGGFFCVAGMTVPSPASVKFKDVITYANFVSFG